MTFRSIRRRLAPAIAAAAIMAGAFATGGAAQASTTSPTTLTAPAAQSSAFPSSQPLFMGRYRNPLSCTISGFIIAKPFYCEPRSISGLSVWDLYVFFI